ncbi:Na/Pi symporter [bacterium]|nr:Na/Pi symporter [bacterium]
MVSTLLFFAVVTVCPAVLEAEDGPASARQLLNVTYESSQKHLVEIVDTSKAIELKVQLVDSSGLPVPDEPVHFDFLSVPAEAYGYHLSEKLAKTGPDGIAATQCYLGHAPGEYYITATHSESEPGAVCIKIHGLERNWASVVFMGLLGGMGMFLYGMVLGSKGLQKTAGQHLRLTMGKLTENRFAGVLIGTLVSTILQSSTAATVMVVGLVSASLLTLKQAIGVVIGANVGTVITIHLIAFKLTNYALMMIGIGFFLRLLSKRKEIWYIGQIIMGFGFVFYGMHVMSLAFEPLKAFPQFRHILLTLNDYPLLILIMALVFTALIHSSGVTIGLMIVLAREGFIPLQLIIPVILGAHIGTTSTALLASIGSNLDSRRIAFFHLFFNLLGGTLFFIFRTPYARLIELLSHQYLSDSLPRMIANANMVYMLSVAFIFLFFIGPIVSFLNWIVKESSSKGDETFKPKYLSNSIMGTPELALDHSLREILRMASFVELMLEQGMEMVLKKESDLGEKIVGLDDKVDLLEQAVRNYLAVLSNKDLTEQQSKKAIALLYIADDIEHMGDVIEIGILSNATKLIEKDIHFSPEGEKELIAFHAEVLKIFRIIVIAIRREDRTCATEVLELKTKISVLEKDLRKKHLDRLLHGRPETIESGTIHMDLLGEMRRIVTLCSKIAHTIIDEF